MSWQNNHRESITVAISGAGGSGALTAGFILLAAAQRCGRYGIMMRSAGPQVRGGESVAILRIGPRMVTNIGDRVDLLAALDWRNIERFQDELALDANSLILHDRNAGAVPNGIAASGAEQRSVDFGRYAAEHSGGRANMIAVGVLGSEMALPLPALAEATDSVLGKKAPAAVEAAKACIATGHRATAAQFEVQPQTEAPSQTETDPSKAQAALQRWRLSGNAAAGLGALRAGVGFVAAYPITPASEMLEWLAPRLERTGGTLLQAEDELAAVNMLVGASFGGVPALTATSGPGLSLMTEGIGLAVASETPILVVDVARGGPSTGLPTKSEQADLNQALYGLHGDAPHLVLAPLDVGDCAYSVEWGSRLAERLQTAAILLSDQALGQTHAVIDPPPRCPPVLGRKRTSDTPALTPTDDALPVNEFARYAPSPDGISPMPSPGEPGYEYTADGLAHNAQGTPSSNAADHRDQLSKLIHKLTAHDYGDSWARIDPRGRADGPADSTISLLTWGSSWGATQEAATRLRAQGVPVQTIGLRLIAPLQHVQLRAAIEGTQVLVVEINATGQLFRYLNAERVLPPSARSFARPGPLPLRPSEIIAQLQPLLEAPAHVQAQPEHSKGQDRPEPITTARAEGGV
ncbi:MAG: 2-oxoacid:acceptor oxidoreductase family protein [Lamprobacter sp.]|uniref:2-oxoacid:acceptor oxidoreductase family protein n=1 Tax=Lamprobacter sp. TaxID=3100796 RepID=UPI002B260555|nr:2-oxoacid:acceptor oxidoreductase family protein [Lamprobacter sp.]MEA3640551.1 2-oxoacid:acceptor oxidoreductase family protein [Lamprobacter sp.]